MIPGSKIAKGCIALVLIAYPVAAYIAHDYLSPRWLLAGLLMMLGLRQLIALAASGQQAKWPWAMVMALWLLAVAVLWWLPDFPFFWFKFYPAALDAVAFVLFFGSLFTAMPLVERIARTMQAQALSPRGVEYTRRITWLWSGLMFMITLISLYTALLASLEYWTVFNGFLVYIVMGAVFGGEYLWRLRVRRHWGEI